MKRVVIEKRIDINVQPFIIHIAQRTLGDLRERLARTRWPDEVEGTSWEYGINLEYLKSLMALLAPSIRLERAGGKAQSLCTISRCIDGFGVHFVHERSQGPKLLPIILTSSHVDLIVLRQTGRWCHQSRLSTLPVQPQTHIVLFRRFS